MPSLQSLFVTNVFDLVQSLIDHLQRSALLRNPSLLQLVSCNICTGDYGLTAKMLLLIWNVSRHSLPYCPEHPTVANHMRLVRDDGATIHAQTTREQTIAFNAVMAILVSMTRLRSLRFDSAYYTHSSIRTFSPSLATRIAIINALTQILEVIEWTPATSIVYNRAEWLTFARDK